MNSRRIHRRGAHKIIASVISELERTRHENNDIMRWEDDGGSVFELETSYSQSGGQEATTIKLVRAVRVHEHIRTGEIQ